MFRSAETRSPLQRLTDNSFVRTHPHVPEENTTPQEKPRDERVPRIIYPKLSDISQAAYPSHLDRQPDYLDPDIFQEGTIFLRSEDKPIHHPQSRHRPRR